MGAICPHIGPRRKQPAGPHLNPNAAAVLRLFMEALPALEKRCTDALGELDAPVLKLQEFAAHGVGVSASQTKALADELERMQNAAIDADTEKNEALSDLLEQLQTVPQKRVIHPVERAPGQQGYAPALDPVAAAAVDLVRRVGWHRASGEFKLPDGRTYRMLTENPCGLELFVVVAECVETGHQRALAIVHRTRHDAKDGNRIGLMLQALADGVALPDMPPSFASTWHALPFINVPESYKDSED
jgi:hypothetical protein